MKSDGGSQVACHSLIPGFHGSTQGFPKALGSRCHAPILSSPTWGSECCSGDDSYDDVATHLWACMPAAPVALEGKARPFSLVT